MLITYMRSAVSPIALGVFLLLAGLFAIALPFVAGIAASVSLGGLCLLVSLIWSMHGRRAEPGPFLGWESVDNALHEEPCYAVENMHLVSGSFNSLPSGWW
jgi:hypothetical protein